MIKVPTHRVVEVNRRKFLQKYGTLDAIIPFLKYKCQIDITRNINCMKDPSNPEVIVFWQNLPNEFLTDIEGKVL